VEFGNCGKQSSSIGLLIRDSCIVVVVVVGGGGATYVLTLSQQTFRCTRPFCTSSTAITISYLGIKIRGGAVSTSKKTPTYTFRNKHQSKKI